MLCDRPSLLMNSTREPAVTDTLRGLEPDDVMVIVLVSTAGSEPGEGTVGDVSPHDTRPRSTAVPASRGIIDRVTIRIASILPGGGGAAGGTNGHRRAQKTRRVR